MPTRRDQPASEEGQKKADNNNNNTNTKGGAQGEKKPAPSNKKSDKDKKEEELSEEDRKKKEELDLLVDRAHDPDAGVQKLALQSLIAEIKSATTSMTSVPKPLKFLRPHYDRLKESFEKLPPSENRALLSDIVSVLAMTMGKPGARESLKYRLNGSQETIGSWGHEYIRNLAGEIGQEFTQRQQDDKPIDDLIRLVDEIVPFEMTHNAEHEACDLLMEVEQLEKIVTLTDETNYSRVCLYLGSCASYVPEPDDTAILKVILAIYTKTKQWPDALRVAIRMHDLDTIKQVFQQCGEDPSGGDAMKKQLAFILGRQHVYLGEEEEGEYAAIISNTTLSENFLALGRDLEIMEAKTPEDVYKSNLSEAKGFSANIDSARQNLASTFVNAFVNAGFGQDKLMTQTDNNNNNAQQQQQQQQGGTNWLYKNKEHGMMSAAASLGMILLWDVDAGINGLDKFLYSSEDYVKAGALLGVGIVNCGVRNEIDPALALLSEYLDNKQTVNMRIGAVLGLGLAYIGSARADLRDLLLPVVEDSKASMELVALAALALGMIFVGTGDTEITEILCSTLMERDEASLNVSHARFLPLGLGLLYLGKQELADVTIETLKALTHNLSKYAAMAVQTCAYAGTGNVLKIQKLLDTAGDHLDEKSYSAHQGVAVLGIGLIAMGEEIGVDMAIRSMDHILQYGEPGVRRAVPLALGLLSISNPRITVMDTLSKLSHDGDEEVALGAILGLGLIGAGTNNARVANMLRGLATYYYKDPNQLFMIRIAQGLVFMGKGTLTLAPYHSDRTLLSHTAMAGLLVVLHAALDFKNILLSKSHYLLYCLVAAMYPRMLMTFDENLKPLPVSVRVGQAVDTIGQAGRPKTITGFQTHTTPVLLGYGDRAELATDDYIPLTSVLEGFVILKINPNATQIDEDTGLLVPKHRKK